MKKPLDWLKCGPGRDLPGNPGWSAPPRTVTIVDQSLEQLRAENREMMRLVREVLQGHPQVLAEVLALLEQRRPPESWH